MKLLCPSCQRELTILDQYAGQQMKCPMCSATFTAPAIPAAPMPPSAAVPAPPPTPEFSQVPAAPPPAAPPPQPTGPTDYTHRFTMFISPKVIAYIAPVCLLLTFFLFFFTWSGSYAGSYGLVTQTGAQTMFGNYSYDTEFFETNPFKKGEKEEGPSWDPFMFLYLLLLLVTVPVAAAVLVLQFAPFKLPPVVQQFLPWRWAILAGLSLLLFLLLALQGTLGFGVENKLRAEAEKELAERNKAVTAKDAKDADPPIRVVPDARTKHRFEVVYAQAVGSLHRTSFYCATWWLHLLSVAACGVMFWFDRRPLAPHPCLEAQI